MKQSLRISSSACTIRTFIYDDRVKGGNTLDESCKLCEDPIMDTLLNFWYKMRNVHAMLQLVLAVLSLIINNKKTDLPRIGGR